VEWPQTQAANHALSHRRTLGVHALPGVKPAPAPMSDKDSRQDKTLSVFEPTELEDLPEESLLRSRRSIKDVSKDKFLGQGTKFATAPADPTKKAPADPMKKGGKLPMTKLTCPMSGASASVKAPAETKKPLQFAVDNPVLVEKRDYDDVNSDKSSTDASRRGSKGSKSMSRGSTRNSGYASSGRISGSRPSQKGSKASRGSDRARRRRRRVPTFSEWEADTYIPHIKSTWDSLTKNHSKERLSLWFADKIVELDPESTPLIQQRGRMVMAGHFWTALDFCSKAVDDPPRLAHSMKQIAAVHVEESVTMDHVVTFGKVLFEMLKNFLGEEMDLVSVTAWEWLWTWLSSTMQMAMEEANEEATVVSQSWDIAQISYPGVRFGQLILDNLFALAPNLRQTFVKPRQLLSVKFAEMIATLVTFNGDSATMEEQIVWLGVRHVGYGARIQHLQVFGQVLMNSMEIALGEEWTFEMHKSWMDLWTNSANRMLEITQNAEKYGEVVRDCWSMCQSKTNATVFGGLLRTSLLSGTEWVQEATTGIKQGLDQVKNKNMDISLQMTRDNDSRSSASKGNFLTRFSKRSSIPSSPTRDGNYTPVKSPKPRGLPGTGGQDSSSEDDNEDEGNREAPPSGRPSRRGSVARSLSTEGSEATLDGPDRDQNQVAAEMASINAETQSDDGVWGRKFWNMITDMLDLLWEPERMSEYITSTTWRLYAIGIRPSNIAQIGQGIGQTIQKIMGRDYKEEHGEAWKWFWEMASKTMDQVLTCMLNEDAQIVRSHWEECKTVRYSDEIGELIFQEIGRLAPHVVHLFKKPKKIQSQQFVAAIDIIVSFNEDPAAFYDLLRPLAIRHIRYGVRPDFTRPFGKAVLRAIKVILGNKYTPRVALAFETLWLRVSTCMTRALAGGSNLIVVALINENIDQLVSALDGAPRCERFDFLTKLSLNGEMFSPLYWAIKESQVEIAKFILDDLLTIRADRHNYYYGREIMFQRHPDLIRVLCEDMPPALPHLFNGLLWHARLVTGGKVRVNFYLKEMYGDPDEVLDPWKGPLGVLVLEGTPETFVHPVIQRLLALKYNRFGLITFAAMQLWFTLILALWTIGSTAHSSRCYLGMYYTRLVAGGLSSVTFLATVVIICRQFMSGQWSVVPVIEHWLHVPLPRYCESCTHTEKMSAQALTCTCFHRKLSRCAPSLCPPSAQRSLPVPPSAHARSSQTRRGCINT